MKIIGSVAEEPDMVRVLVRSRTSVFDITLTQMQVISLRMGPNGWGIMLSAEVAGMAEALRVGLGLE